MRITFSFELPDLNLNVYNQKFAFKVPNGIWLHNLLPGDGF